MTTTLAAALAAKAGRAAAAVCCPVLELRQYTLKPGRRDMLIDLFDQNFVESQEALGMTIAGQFRDFDNPDRFVWLRGYPNMATRAQALAAFYGGPVWKAHSKAANATMIDSDNVLLLHPAKPEWGFALDNARPPFDAKGHGRGAVIATICSFETAAGEASFVDFFAREVQPIVDRAGGAVRAALATQRSPNNFPALPVRENEKMFVWFSSFANGETYEAHLAKLSQSSAWRALSPRLRQKLNADPQILRLSPTARSLLHG